MKSFIVGFVALLSPVFTFAAVSEPLITTDAPSYEEGATITVTVEASRSGSGCSNNWGYTKYLLDGPQIGTTTLDVFSGTGTTTDTFSFTATGVGSHTLRAELWSGEEDFNNGGASPD